MLKNVEEQKKELMKVKEEFDNEQIELTQRLNDINAGREALKLECQALQKEMK